VALKALAQGRVFAEVTGRGDTVVVFLHGWGRDRGDLTAVGAGLDARCLYLDLPGFGSSPPPERAWGAREYADLVAEAVDDHLDGARPGALVLVGHSFGGRVALCWAARRPEEVTGLVLAGVPLLRPEGRRPPLAFRLARAMHRRGLLSDATMERYRQRFGSADYRAARGVMRETLVRTVAESYETELAAVRCPVTLVWGEQDTAAPLEMARAAEQLLVAPHRLVVVDGVGHDVHLERPELLRAEIERRCEASR
jgi:pimeloyl-ACP methyl ester carboxylesterase